MKDVEEEGAMEEDEVEEMDVVEDEMAEGEDEDHPVQLVDEEAEVQMRQTFHQIADHHVKDLAAEAVEAGLVDVTMDEVEAVEGMVCHFESVQVRRDGRHQSVIGEVH